MISICTIIAKTDKKRIIVIDFCFDIIIGYLLFLISSGRRLNGKERKTWLNSDKELIYLSTVS